MSQRVYNVRIRISPPAPDQRLTYVVNVRVEAGNAPRAKGLAALKTQTDKPGCALEVLDVWEMLPECDVDDHEPPRKWPVVGG